MSPETLATGSPSNRAASVLVCKVTNGVEHTASSTRTRSLLMGDMDQFYRRSVRQRQSILAEDMDFPFPPLSLGEADRMIENCVGTLSVPLATALHIVLDNESLIVPMATEEPSVVAGLCGAAKTICQGGVLVSEPAECNFVIAQILVPNAKNPDKVRDFLVLKKSDIIAVANTFCPRMVARGGGVVDINVRKVAKSRIDEDATGDFMLRHLPNETRSTHWVIVHLLIDVCESMGANCASTVAEGTAHQLKDMLFDVDKCSAAVKIVSNLVPLRTTTVNFSVPVSKLAYKNLSGEQVAANILQTYFWAKDDIYRATTHNKGILNGIDAVALATGQDWRAIEASAHSWACFGGNYGPLTSYWIENTSENILCGKLELPLLVGTMSSVPLLPQYKAALNMLNCPDTKRLACIMCAVGLLQNFAALRALSTEGIQCGHMRLHARKAEDSEYVFVE